MMQSCPVLNSMFNEVIRFYSTGSSVRRRYGPCVSTVRLLPKGTRFLLPQRQLRVAPEAFGEDADRINPYRFHPTRDLRPPRVLPPIRRRYYALQRGKTVGRYEVLSFVAWALVEIRLRSRAERWPGGGWN